MYVVDLNACIITDYGVFVGILGEQINADAILDCLAYDVNRWELNSESLLGDHSFKS